MGPALKQAVLLLGVASLPAAATLFFDPKWEPPAEFHAAKAADVHAHLDHFVSVDVRDEERYEKAHIPGALSVKETEPDRGIDRIRTVWMPGKKIVVYGEGSGSDRALRVARLIKKELRTKEVLLLEGGWAAWPRS